MREGRIADCRFQIGIPDAWCFGNIPASQRRRDAKSKSRKVEETVKLAELLKYNLRSVRSYLMREDIQQFCEYSSPGCGGPPQR
jgi:hypothetical protein